MRYYNKLENKQVLCELCPNYCIISKDKISSCNARKNIDGELVSLTYSNVAAINIDPIEKKPLFHFLPGSKTLSIGTAGCNMHCKNCQNNTLSQSNPLQIPAKSLSPKEIVKLAKDNNCESISYTYNEPTVFFELMLDTAIKAKKSGLKNVMVSNGYINIEPLVEIIPYLDAANIDLKSFNNSTYKTVFKSSLEPVLASIKELYRHNVWLEITNLIIPGITDRSKEIEQMCEWIIANTDTNTPVHFSRFFPQYLLNHLEPTPEISMKTAFEISNRLGLKNVYLGNLSVFTNNTVCSKCGKEVIVRNELRRVLKININNSLCSFCGRHVHGVWR